MVVHCGVSASVALFLPWCWRRVLVGGRARTLSPEELARDVEGLASHDDDLLAVQELLGHDRGEAAKEMALAIDDDLFANPSAPFHPPALPTANRPPDTPETIPSHQLRLQLPPGQYPRAVSALQVKTHNRLESRHRFRTPLGREKNEERKGECRLQNQTAGGGEEV